MIYRRKINKLWKVKRKESRKNIYRSYYIGAVVVTEILYNQDIHTLVYEVVKKYSFKTAKLIKLLDHDATHNGCIYDFFT